MSVVKVIEIIAQSPEGWEEAAQMALREASKTLKSMLSDGLNDLAAPHQPDKKICRVNARISLVVEDNRA